MCGIFCSISKHRHVPTTPQLHKLLQARGPDSTGQTSTIVDIDDVKTYVTLKSTVLSLRGDRTVSQPYQDSSLANALCWNGEAWSIGGLPTAGNDTQSMHSLLIEATKTPDHAAHSALCQRKFVAETVARHLSTVAGPYAFVFYDKAHSRMLFGRDFLGRRSLLRRITDKGELLLSSVSTGSDTSQEAGEGSQWTEVEADGLYCVDFATNDLHSTSPGVERWGDFKVLKVPYHFPNEAEPDTPKSVIPFLSLNKHIPSEHPTLSAASPAIFQLEHLLRQSLTVRVLNIPDPPSNAINPQDFDKARLAILFSGGLDCTVLARITHDLLPPDEPIDLLNVAFENPRIHKEGASASPYELCPDRVTARCTYAELQRVCPSRQWRLVTIDIPYAETLEHRENVVRLMHPHNTEMDLSICYALYFAARGIGTVNLPNSTKSMPYATSARVLLSGLGADELFGGYQRHATAFSRHGYAGLIEELELDVGRLGKRNLGRDDRVIANWGREARFPFLDEELVGWALDAAVNEKCGFGETVSNEHIKPQDDSMRLEPGKKVLRCLAWKLGMHAVAAEKKRAIQFGARTAKMETGKTKGTAAIT